MFPGVVSSCKNTHSLYLRHYAGRWRYKDNSDRDPTPSMIVGGEEDKVPGYAVGDRCHKRGTDMCRAGGVSS